MAVAASLSADALTLLESIGRDPEHLQAPLTRISHDSRVAVSSFLGVEVALLVHGQRLSLEHWDPGTRPEDGATSLQIPTSALLGPDHGGTVTWWAGTPGALVDLATDVTYALGLPDADVVLAGTCRPRPRLTGSRAWRTSRTSTGHRRPDRGGTPARAGAGAARGGCPRFRARPV